MIDKDILKMLEKYKKKELEMQSDYNIKKEKLEKEHKIKEEELEKEHKKQQIDNKFQLLNFISQKQEEAKNRYEALSQIRNALFGNDGNEGLKELIYMARKIKATFENDNNNQGIQLREGTEINEKKKSNFIEEKSEKERKEEDNEFEEKEKKETQMKNKKRERPF